MNILVTGGAGYVGSTLVPKLLQHGHRVRVVDSLLHGGMSLLAVWGNPRLEFLRGDIRNDTVLHDAITDMDAVVHLAAIVGDPACARDPALTLHVNRDASLALFHAACAGRIARFVFASTCSNYGRMPDPAGFVDETSPLAPVSLYAETKVGVEQALLNSSSRRVRTTVLRFATVYGVSPRMRFDLTVNEFTAEMIVKRRLAVFGEQFWRPYVHVADVARAVTQVLESRPEQVDHQVFNVGASNQNFRKQDLVALIRPYAPEAVVEYVRRDEDPRDYRVSFARIRTCLGFEPLHTVHDGIAEVARLVRSGIVADLSRPEYRN